MYVCMTTFELNSSVEVQGVNLLVLESIIVY